MRPTISTIDQRSHPRYVANPAIEGRFGDLDVALVNISVSGALIRHASPAAPTEEQVLRLYGDFSSLAALHAEVIWTRQLSAEGEFFESGVQFIQWIEVAQRVIDKLIERGAVRLDTSRPPSRIVEPRNG